MIILFIRNVNECKNIYSHTQQICIARQEFGTKLLLKGPKNKWMDEWMNEYSIHEQRHW